MKSVWAWRFLGAVVLAFVAARPDAPMGSLQLLGGIACFINGELDKAEAER